MDAAFNGKLELSGWSFPEQPSLGRAYSIKVKKWKHFPSDITTSHLTAEHLEQT